MKDDYLWDKTGDPDPEIQRLEEVLGTLRHEPRPLELPSQGRISSPKTLDSRIAIAAVIGTALIGGASWWLLHRQTSAPADTTAKSSTVESRKDVSKTAINPASNEVAKPRTFDGTAETSRIQIGIRRNLLAGNKKARQLKFRDSELSSSDRAEAQAAKEQLLLALRVASAKLSMAQKKTQVGYPGNLIRNQHKVG